MKIAEMRSKLTFNEYTKTKNADYTTTNVISNTFYAWGKIVLLTRVPVIAGTDDILNAKVTHNVICRHSDRIVNSSEFVSDGITYKIHYTTPIEYGRKCFVKLFCEQITSSQTTVC